MDDTFSGMAAVYTHGGCKTCVFPTNGLTIAIPAVHRHAHMVLCGLNKVACGACNNEFCKHSWM